MKYSDDQVLLGLTRVPGLGPVGIRELVEVLAQKSISLSDFWIHYELVKSSLKIPWSLAVREAYELVRTHVQLSLLYDDVRKNGCEVLTFLDNRFPKLLLSIVSCPTVLYVMGDIDLLQGPGIAVVGTRRISRYGKLATEYFTSELCQRKFVIISGFMYGVDAHAHRTAVQQGGKTVGVLGYGFDHIYPKTHTKLFKQMLESGGCFISEYPPEVPPIPSNFPQRNRIVAGLAKGLLVTEASANSGSKITAQFAADMGREVFAVSGSFTSPFSEGTKQLINLGAKLVTKIDDILEEVERNTTSSIGTAEQQQINFAMSETQEEKAVFDLLRVCERSIDELVEDLHVEMPVLLSTVSMMEMKGVVVQDKGKYWLAKLSTS